jgi:peptidoglycan/LPS O-acetylase OafA/YrhL
VGPTQDAPVERDTFLELLRNVSVLRVVFLHLVLRPPLIYLPWIQWIYPGMPEIFFVSGVLMAGSLARRPTTAVVRDRARRVVVPFAAYVPFALGAMYVTDSRSSDPKASMVMRDVIGYLVPLVEPGGSQSRQILWSHLWFVTAFLWAILLAPLLVRLIDRIGAFVLGLPLGVFAAAIFVRKYLERPVPEEFVNISQFGTFFVLGLLAGRKRLGVLMPGHPHGVRWWTGIAVVCGTAGVLVATVIEPISNKRPAELYSSRTAYLFVGAAWLALALAFHQQLAQWTARHRNRFITACTNRTFTLYLWGLPADAVGTSVAKRLLPNRWMAIPTYLSVSLGLLFVAVLAFGWLEDFSARRPLRLLPRG